MENLANLQRNMSVVGVRHFTLPFPANQPTNQPTIELTNHITSQSANQPAHHQTKQPYNHPADQPVHHPAKQTNKREEWDKFSMRSIYIFTLNLAVPFHFYTNKC